MALTVNRGRIYSWEEGDTFALIALKYHRSNPKDYLQVLDLNKGLVSRNHYIMKPGDAIEIPESWFPLRSPEREVKIVGTRGHVIVTDGIQQL